jgi:hypothetical protein
MNTKVMSFKTTQECSDYIAKLFEIDIDEDENLISETTISSDEMRDRDPLDHLDLNNLTKAEKLGQLYISRINLHMVSFKH